MPSPTAYDDAFRMLIEDHPRLTLNLINFMFKDALDKPFDGTEKVEKLQNEQIQEDSQTRRITDAYIKVIRSDGSPKYFHIECQSQVYGDMAIRIYEYDSRISMDLSHFDRKKGVMHVRFPDSGLLYLRSRKSTKSHITVKMSLPGNKEASFDIPVLKMQELDVDVIFANKLYFLIPFYLFNLEHCWKTSKGAYLETSEENIALIKSKYEDISRRLHKSLENGFLTDYELSGVLEAVKAVSALLLRKVPKVMGEVESAMRKNTIEYEGKRIYKAGIAEGIAKGMAEGLAKGKADGIIEGMADGKNKGISLINVLNARLAELGRVSDIVKAANDPKFQNELLKELNLA